MGLSSELSCEAGCFSSCQCNPHRSLQPELFRLHFLALDPWVAWSVSLPSCSFCFICTHMWDCPVCQPPPLPPSPPASTLPGDLSALAALLRPSYLDECFFFNSLVVGLSYSLIFGQFWLFFVFKFVVVFLLVV